MSTGRRGAIAAMRAGAVALALLAAAPARAADADDRLRALADEFVARWLDRSPEQATQLGVHDRAALLVPVTQATLAEDREWYRDFARRLGAVPRAELSPERALDRDLLEARTERVLVDLEVMRPFERDPAAYLPLIAGSVRSVLARPYASPCVRVRAAARRLAQVSEVLRAARINLHEPPAALAEAAVGRLEDVLRFYRESVPALAANCRDARLQADLAQADTAAVRALESFIEHVRELGRASGGPLAVGADGCARWLAAELMQRVSIDSLVAGAEREIERERGRERVLVAAAVADEADAAVRLEHGRMVDAVHRVAEFARRRDLVARKRGDEPDVRAAAAYVAEPVTLDAPGPWEVRSSHAWIEVATGDSAGADDPDRPHARRFSPWDADLMAMREAFPGRLIRAEALGGLPRLRRALLSTWPADGWAGFAERVMLDEGYGSGEPRLALAAARAALRRHGRTRAALGLHTGALTLDGARAMLVERCGLAEEDARVEAQRAACEPAAMGYTHAVSDLIALRDEAQRRLGARFKLKVFDHAVLRFGAAPIGFVRASVEREMGAADDRATTSGAER